MKTISNSRHLGFVAVLLSVTVVFAIAVLGLVEPVLSQKSSDLGDGPNSFKVDLLKSRPQSELRVVENPDSPLRIISARVFDISSEEFSRLTGKTLSIPYVSSVPEVELINVSDKIVTHFMIVVRNPGTQSMQAIQIPKLRIAPNESFVLKRQDFVPEPATTFADSLGVRKVDAEFNFDSERSWLTLGTRSEIYVAVGIVGFSDGSKWMIKEGGDVQ